MLHWRNFHNLYIRINTHLIQHIHNVNVARWKAAFVTVKIPPQVRGYSVDMGGTHVDVASAECRRSKLFQERYDIDNRIKDVTTDYNIGGEIFWGFLPDCLYIGDICQASFARIAAQIIKHCRAWLNGSKVFYQGCECQGEASGACADIEYGCLWNNYIPEFE